MTANRLQFAWLVLMAILALAFQPARAEVRSSPKHEAHLAVCIRNAAGGRAWLEKTLWGLRDQEGGWIGAEVQNGNGSHDLGPLQVNSFWVPKLSKLTGRPPTEVRRWLINDACFNVQAARWIFLSGLRVTQDYWEAVGVYHSPTLERQLRYRKSVAHRLVSRFGRAVFPPGSHLIELKPTKRTR